MSSGGGVGARASSLMSPLLLMLVLVQLLNTFFANSISVYGPVVTADLGLPAQAVGIWIGLAFVTSIVSSFFLVGTTKRVGPVRSMQIGVVLHTVGFTLPALSLLGGGTASAVLGYALGALTMGMGAGVLLPASAQILQRVAPPGRLAIMFSIKQTGVPFSIALAGILVPFLVETMPWRYSLLAVAVWAIPVLLLLQPYRRTLDDARDPAAPLTGSGVAEPVRLAARDPVMRALSVSGLCFGAVQLATIGYLVTYLKLEIGLTLAAAGAAWSAGQMSTVLSRVLWGWVSDRTRAPIVLLGVIALASAAMAAVLALMSRDWSYGAIVAVCIGYLVFAMGWNGVYLATVTSFAPPGQLASAMVGTQFVTFIGMMSGPLLFAGVISIAGYGAAFAVLAALSVIGGVALLRVRKR